MTAYNYLYIIAIGLVVIGWDAQTFAEGDVTVADSSSAATQVPMTQALAPDGTPVVHKSFHKKKTDGSAVAAALTVGSSVALTAPSPLADAIAALPQTAPSTIIAPATAPAVETGLPVARHSTDNGLTIPNPASLGATATLPSVSYSNVPAPRSPGAISYSASGLGTSLTTGVSTTVSGYPAPVRTPGAADNLNYTNFNKKKKNTYPWKKDIITTVFWIGEGSTPISATTNEASAWDEDWSSSNSGSDSPNDHRGYLPAHHAATVNPFYIALPFNDLAFPDKAREWLPSGWHRPPKDGKQVSACQHRWVEIKSEDGSGLSCYAQWEDVGPLRYDHAEYVFGSERPDTYSRAGLDVSPAVAKFLDINDKNRVTRWRFVDDEDVPPGVWLKYDEQALLYKAIKELKASSAPLGLPIERSTAPIEDPLNINSNKKTVGAAKG